jgi:acyl-CoA reductase-like NAD-dependent aldehyde dehydrogenase
VLTDVPAEAEIASEETFGPVALLETVDGPEEALRRANASRYGLTAGIISADTYRALDLARRLEVGIVHINDQTVNDEPHMPFGGVKDSGWGRFGLHFTDEDFTELQWITLRDSGRSFPF